jgi:hypothetical protein
MGSFGVSGHSQIMPDFPPLRQPELASFRVPFIPRLKPGVYWHFLLKEKFKELIKDKNTGQKNDSGLKGGLK